MITGIVYTADCMMNRQAGACLYHEIIPWIISGQIQFEEKQLFFRILYIRNSGNY